MVGGVELQLEPNWDSQAMILVVFFPFFFLLRLDGLNFHGGCGLQLKMVSLNILSRVFGASSPECRSPKPQPTGLAHDFSPTVTTGMACMLVLWMVAKSISHHCEPWLKPVLLVFTGESSLQGLLGGAGFCLLTVSQVSLMPCHLTPSSRVAGG